jgi:hypothetical protein
MDIMKIKSLDGGTRINIKGIPRSNTKKRSKIPPITRDTGVRLDEVIVTVKKLDAPPVSPKKKTVSPKKKTVSHKKKTVSPKNKTVSPKKKRLPKIKTVSSKKISRKKKNIYNSNKSPFKGGTIKKSKRISQVKGRRISFKCHANNNKKIEDVMGQMKKMDTESIKKELGTNGIDIKSNNPKLIKDMYLFMKMGGIRIRKE